jgi:acylphosphatase
MKVTKLLKYNLAALLVLTAFFGYARQQSEKKKVIEESYQVSTSTLLKLNNKFGRIEIESWSKNEFDIRIEIIARGRNEERSQRILDDIDIDMDESSSAISIETLVDRMKNKNNEGFEVNYFISMPEENPLDIKNSFGDVTMGNRLGDLDINVSYGSMKVGDVKGATDLRLSFGSGSINKIGNGDMTIKYSSFNIESAEILEMTQGFSDVEIDEVKELELESKYGGVEIEKVHEIEADVHFSSFEIDELTGKLELESSYIGDFRIKRLANSFTLVDIEGKFGSYEIGLEPGLNANIEAEFSFADLKSYSDVDVEFHYKVKESNKSIYKGKIGQGDDNKMIRVDSSYGNLRLREY